MMLDAAAALIPWVLLVFAGLFLVLSALFRMAGAAFETAAAPRIARLERSGDRRAARATRLIEDPDRRRVLAFAASVAGLCGIALAITLPSHGFGMHWLWGVALALPLVTLFGFIWPTNYGRRHADRLALSLSAFAQQAMRFFLPVLALGDRIVGLGPPPTPEEPDAHAELQEEIERRAAEAPPQPPRGRDDRDMIEDLLDLRDLLVYDVMVHRTKVVMLNADDPPEKLIRESLSARFGRLPLWREGPGNIVGILDRHDLLLALTRAGGDGARVAPTALAKEPWFVPDTTPLLEQLRGFRSRNTGFAVVVDEYGEVEGIVTLADILDEIVGDIGETETTPGIRRLPDGGLLVDGALPIRELNRAMDWELPDEEANTIAGLVIHEAQSIPEPGQSFTFHGLRFQVLRKARNRLTALRITKVAAAPEPNA